MLVGVAVELRGGRKKAKSDTLLLTTVVAIFETQAGGKILKPRKEENFDPKYFSYSRFARNLTPLALFFILTSLRKGVMSFCPFVVRP